MKIVAKKIDMIAWFKKDGKIKPLKFKIEEEGSYKVIKVDRVIKNEIEKFAGNVMQVFDCQSEIDGELRIYQLKYEIETNQWILFKI